MSEQELPDGFIKEPVQQGVEDGVQWAVYPAPLYGAINGYVYVPESHPGHWKDYDDDAFDSIEVHGGLTFSHSGWIGFDTLHSGDWWPEMYMKGGSIHWTEGMVVEETKNLARQIAEGVKK